MRTFSTRSPRRRRAPRIGRTIRCRSRRSASTRPDRGGGRGTRGRPVDGVVVGRAKAVGRQGRGRAGRSAAHQARFPGPALELGSERDVRPREGNVRADAGTRAAATARTPGTALRRQGAGAPGDRPGDGHERQGRPGQARHGRRLQPAGRERDLVRRAVTRGASARFPVAPPSRRAASRLCRHPQPFALRERPGRARCQAGAAADLAATLRPDQRMGGRARERGHDDRQALPQHRPRRAESSGSRRDWTTRPSTGSSTRTTSRSGRSGTPT